MSRSRSLALVLLVSLLAACGPDADTTGSGGPTRTAPSASDVAGASGGTAGADPRTPTTSTDGEATPATATADGAAEDAPPAPDDTTGGEPDPDRTRAPDAVGAGPGIAAGTYRYDVEGSTSVGTFPPQPFEAVLTTVAEPIAADGTQRAATTTEFTDGSSPRSLDEQRTLHHSPDDIRLVRLVTDGNGEPIEFVLDPPAVLTPIAPAPGQSWEWTMTSTDGRTTAHTVVTARGSETLAIGGARVDTRVADATVTFTGEDFEGTQQVAIWFDPQTRLTVRQDSSLQGRARVGGAWFDIAADDRRFVRSLVPA